MNWLSKWHSQMLYFPNTAHDDGVDATVQAMAVLDKMGFLRGKVIPPRPPTYWQKRAVGSYS